MLSHGTMVSFRSELLLRAISGCTVLHQPQSELMSVVPVATGGCADAQGLVSHLRPFWYPRAVLSLGPFLSG